LKQLQYIALAAVIVGLIAVAVWLQQKTMIAGLPPRHVCQSQLDAKAQAGLGAVEVLGTGSMAPYIPAAPSGLDPLKTVMAYAAPSGRTFDDIRKGDLVIYKPNWSNGLVIHQAAKKDKGGWIMSGLHNAQSESFTRITKDDLICVVDAVYVW
jgi:hypothetical protein